jgi:hypothetical protein
VAAPYASDYGCWSYDPFGNRTLEAYSSVTSTPCATGANDNVLSVSTPMNTTLNNNQLAASIATYDTAGNVTQDGVIKYLYDGEGRLCAVENILTTVAPAIFTTSMARAWPRER